MGVRNYLIEGVSGTGKTTVADELIRRGHHAIHGDRELAYQGDPVTGEPTDVPSHHHHLWDVDRVRALAADDSQPATSFCDGSRNFSYFIDLFDQVFVLQVDVDTLHRRLDQRPAGEWGAAGSERDLIVRLHTTQEDVPRVGIPIDATPPVGDLVDEILRLMAQIPAEHDRCSRAFVVLGRGDVNAKPAAPTPSGRPARTRAALGRLCRARRGAG